MHSPLSLPPPEFDTSDEELTRDVEIDGINRQLDEFRAQRHDDLRAVTAQLGSLAGEIREANRASKRIEASIATLSETVGQLRDWIREVDQKEQPRQTVRRKRK